VIREVSETIATAQGEPRASWYRFMGDAEDEADFMVSSLNTRYTAIDEDGKKAKQMMDKWKESVEGS